MADTPKTSRRTTRPAQSTTLSASQALKAAEAAIVPEPAKPKPKAPPRKDAAPKKSPTRTRAQPAAKTPDVGQSEKADAAAVVAATTAVDAPPVPDTASGTQAIAAPIRETIKSLPQEAVEDAMPLPALEGTTMMNEVMENGKKFAEDTKVKLETAYADFNEKAKTQVEKSTKAIEEMSDIAKGNVEAMVESGKIAAKAMETMSQEAVDYTRKSFEKATASFKMFATVKTPTEFFQMQSQLLSSNFDEMTKEAAKHSEAMMKLAGDVAQPLTARMTVVTDKVKALAV